MWGEGIPTWGMVCLSPVAGDLQARGWRSAGAQGFGRILQQPPQGMTGSAMRPPWAEKPRCLSGSPAVGQERQVKQLKTGLRMGLQMFEGERKVSLRFSKTWGIRDEGSWHALKLGYLIVGEVRPSMTLGERRSEERQFATAMACMLPSSSQVDCLPCPSLSFILPSYLSSHLIAIRILGGQTTPNSFSSTLHNKCLWVFL